MNEIHIAIAFDRTYIKPFYVLTTSIFLNSRKKNIVIHVLSRDLNDQDRALMTEHAERLSGSIRFYTVDATLIKDLSVPENSPFSTAIFYRLLFPNLLPPGVSKLLYLDTDIVVTEDLSPLFDIALNTTPVAAVTDSAMPVRADLGMASKDEYFNSGVLLINVDLWKKQRITEKAISYILCNNRNLYYVDQDALNKVLYRNWQSLDRRYNAMPMYLKTFETNPGSLIKPVIAHYAGQPKPWGARYTPYKEAYDVTYQQFLNISIGQKSMRTDLEEAFASMIGIESSFQQWGDEKLAEWAFLFHLIWLKKVQELLLPEAFDLLILQYYSAYTRSEELLQSFANTFSVSKEKSRLLCKRIFHHSADDGMLPRWTRRWNELCEQEIETRVIADSALTSAAPISRLTVIPEFINEHLMIVEPTRSLLFFMLEKTLEYAGENSRPGIHNANQG